MSQMMKKVRNVFFLLVFNKVKSYVAMTRTRSRSAWWCKICICLTVIIISFLWNTSQCYSSVTGKAGVNSYQALNYGAISVSAGVKGLQQYYYVSDVTETSSWVLETERNRSCLACLATPVETVMGCSTAIWNLTTDLGDRTHDVRAWNPTLYQQSYASVILGINEK